MNILVTGGCGYVGSVLVNALLNDGHLITVVDMQWFGNNLSAHPNLTVIKADMRNIDQIPFQGKDVVIHLANIANDPAVELLPTLSWEVNVLATQQMAERAIKYGIRQIIYASSGSVYGVKDDPEVTENLELVPISVYNKTKMVAERVLLSYQNNISIHCIRPATVCGWSPRMRLDVSVNMLTYQALENQKVTVFGGGQTRPNIHILDMVRVYQHFLKNPLLDSGCYNAGFENISILEIAKKISLKIPTEIVVTKSNDPRSYRQNSNKLISTGFTPNYSVDYAIDELIEKFKLGLLKETVNSYTIKRMKSLKISL